MARELTQPANPNWPFLYSVDPRYGVVKNVPTETTPRVALLPGVLNPKPNPQAAWPFRIPQTTDLFKFPEAPF